MPVKRALPVVRFGEWHKAQPILPNRLAPLVVEGVEAAGVGGADNMMKLAKFTTSDDMQEAVPIVLTLSQSLMMFV